MSNTPGDNPAGDNSGENPFKGTPFEQIFNALGGLPGQTPGQGGIPGGLPAGFDLNQIFSQLQSMMQPPTDGPVNWDSMLDTARKTAAHQPDPTPGDVQRNAVADAIRLADHWLEDTTPFESGVVTTAAWSRADWIVNTFEVWKHLITPVAEQSTAGLTGAMPEEFKTVAGPMLGMLSGAMGSMMAAQAGSGIGGLAGEVMGSSDIGLPLGPVGTAALVPINIASFAEGLDVGGDDVLLYLALREAAHQRLFANVAWLRDYVLGAVRDYATGVQLDASMIEEQIREIDLSNPASLQQALSGGLFEPPKTDQQKAALERIEVVLALVEGWVDEVVTQATAQRMPVATKLAEAVRRRRATGGPAEATFATLVGLELRPKLLREASSLWGSLRSRQGIEARDGVWMSPHLLPTAADLADPLGFREGAEAPAELSAEDFDAELSAWLEGRPTGHSDSGQSDSGQSDSDGGEGEPQS